MLGEELFYLRQRIHNYFAYRNSQKRFNRDHFGAGIPWVMSGPFKGIKYLKETVMGPPLPRLLGTYEAELHELFQNTIFKREYEQIVVAGSGEGYYSCGLGVRYPETPVLSFEATYFSRWQQRRLLKLNKVQNVKIFNKLEVGHFHVVINNKKTLCIMDIEGGELDLLGKGQQITIEKTDLVIEVHASGGLSAGEVLKRLQKNLAPTHLTKIMLPVERDVLNLKKILGLQWGEDELRESVMEHRGFSQVWLWAESRRNLI